MMQPILSGFNDYLNHIGERNPNWKDIRNMLANFIVLYRPFILDDFKRSNFQMDEVERDVELRCISHTLGRLISLFSDSTINVNGVNYTVNEDNERLHNSPTSDSPLVKSVPIKDNDEPIYCHDGVCYIHNNRAHSRSSEDFSDDEMTLDSRNDIHITKDYEIQCGDTLPFNISDQLMASEWVKDIGGTRILDKPTPESIKAVLGNNFQATETKSETVNLEIINSTNTIVELD